MNLYDDSNPVQTLDTNSVLTNTFFRMFLGLAASAIAAFYAWLVLFALISLKDFF